MVSQFGNCADEVSEKTEPGKTFARGIIENLAPRFQFLRRNLRPRLRSHLKRRLMPYQTFSNPPQKHPTF